MPGITDELFLSASVKKFGKSINLSGAMNHCTMGEEFMPMKLVDDILLGKNKFENKYEPITFLHCDILRRNPSEEYFGRQAELVAKCFNLEKEVIKDWKNFYSVWKEVLND